MQEAAFLCGERGWTQQRIADHFGVTQPLVSRMLKEAERRGWFVRSYRFAAEALPPERVAQLRRLGEPKTLLQLLAGVKSDNRVCVRDVRIVGSPSKSGTRQGIQRRFNQFGREAAGLLGGWLPRSELFAVTWGMTISHVVNAMRPPVGLKGGLRTRFTPVCCEPLDKQSEQDTSTKLARRLHQLVETSAEAPPSLSGVPALISRRYRGADERAIRNFFRDAASYKEVFGPSPRPLIDTVDSLLTSVGAASRPLGFVNDELLRAGSTRDRKLTAPALSKLVAGDIGGVLIPRRSLSALERREVLALNAMWTGIRREHLERIATEASDSDRPGVIVASIGGEGRAETIAEAVKCGLVNVLIIDPDLANALARVLAS